MEKTREATSEQEAGWKGDCRAGFCMSPKERQQLFPASDSRVVHSLERAGKMAWRVVMAQGTRGAERAKLENLVKKAKEGGHAQEKGWSPLRQERKGRQKMSPPGKMLDLDSGTNSF